MPVNHCQHGIEYDDPDGPCDQCLAEYPRRLPDWSMIVFKMKAELDAIEHRIQKLEEEWQSRK